MDRSTRKEIGLENLFSSDLEILNLGQTWTKSEHGQFGNGLGGLIHEFDLLSW